MAHAAHFIEAIRDPTAGRGEWLADLRREIVPGQGTASLINNQPATVAVLKQIAPHPAINPRAE